VGAARDRVLACAFSFSFFFLLEVFERGALVWHGSGFALRVDVGGRDQPVVGTGAGDVPVVVVEKYVVVSAEEDAIGQVGVSVVSGPLVDVVSLGPGSGPVAFGPPAAAVSGG